MLHSAPDRTAPRIAGLQARLGAVPARSDVRVRSTVVHLVAELAAIHPDATALAGSDESLTFSDLAARQARYARWALGEGFAAGDGAALLMHDRPDRHALWLGLARAGMRVALLDPALRGTRLARCLAVAAPKLLVVDPALADALGEVQALASGPVTVRWQGPGADLARLDLEAADLSDAPLGESEAAGPAPDDPALLLLGTDGTGRPLRVGASHGRLMAWMHGAGGCPAPFRDLVATGASLLRGATARVGGDHAALS
ncbi:AMP-binding protein [Methylobacterium dankookense]|uniref:Surfactin synthase subunit 2 n=2 Tax=Methylobacterium dankookense TaxID=560405 RepID=A0A564FXY8_9HYPH|nr:AMP-binding protein [Methylobacterium dankookense]VUF12862.1 Surfactin synthase subunit 2 [Methylobacterium dankookense]